MSAVIGRMFTVRKKVKMSPLTRKLYNYLTENPFVERFPTEDELRRS